ncbi:MAG: putative cysteine peptidase [Christensenellales bacterium]
MILNERHLKVKFKLIVILFIFMFSLIWGAFSVNAYAEEELNIEKYIEQFETMGIESPKDYITKQLQDFNGKEYILIETIPCGYYIFDKKESVMIEGSIDAVSPYVNYFDNIVYGGAMNYYINHGQEYFDLKNNEYITVNTINALKEISSFLSDNTQLMCANKRIKNKSIFSTSESSTAGTSYYVYNYRSISNLSSNFGYYSIPDEEDPSIRHGICGYIAAALAINYNYINKSSKWIVNPTYHNPNNQAPTIAFVEHLVQIGSNLGFSNSTYSSQIRDIVNNYINGLNINESHTSLWTPFFTFTTIKNHIKNDRPVILFGSLPKFPKIENDTKINHAVLCFGVLDGILADYYYVHYGWDGYNNIMLSTSNATLGSIYSTWGV